MPERGVHSRNLPIALALLLIGSGLVAVAYGVGLLRRQAAPPSTLTAVGAPSGGPVERLIPTATVRTVVAASTSPAAEAALLSTRTPVGGSVEVHSPTPSHTAVVVSSWPTSTLAPPVPSATDILAEQVTATGFPAEMALHTPRERIGLVAPLRDVERYDVGQLGAGWYISCQNGRDLVPGARMECAQLVGVTGGVLASDLAALEVIAASSPGRLWLVGNEPDVIWQLSATPEEYAHLYHDIHQALEEADPTCQVAIGGISQVTPLRLRYLDEVMTAYEQFYGEPIPVDVWNIHLAILREERGTWGVDIPPGMPDDAGMLYEIEDNGDIELLKGQVVAFRRWMAERGLRNKPLIVTEFSILMPPEYGFPPEHVQSFMLAAFDFLMTASDGELGYPPDGNRLVQRWAWYSLADSVYATGNLFDPNTGRITALGQTFAAYTAGWQ